MQYCTILFFYGLRYNFIAGKIDKSWDYHKLWNELFPIGVDMVSEAVRLIESGKATWTEQDERFATFEPSWDRPRLKRNELIQIGRAE